MLSNITKMWWESDVMKQWKNLLLVAYVFNVKWEILFFESGDTEVFKAGRNKLSP